MKLLPRDEIPRQLLEIPQPPKQLYIVGELPQAGSVYLTIVGSRNHTSYGKDVCEMLIGGLCGYPVVIVSGLALGIDSVVHRSAIHNNLTTMAFPGSGLSRKVLYPASNRVLAEKILEAGGCLISEFDPETKAAMWTFPQRNRLMAGISRATLIIEAEEQSGTLITSRLATDYNRDVLVVPGSIYSSASKGTNALLRIGATPITSKEDLITALGFTVDTQAKVDRALADCSIEERNVLALLSEPTSRDELIRSIGKPIAETNALLSILEIKGLIKEELGEVRRC